MRRTLTVIAAIGLTVAAQAYPFVSSDPNTVELNVWNTGLTQAKAKAKALNRPTLMVMLDSVNCAFSKAWIANIADTPAWQTYLASNPLVLVMADKTKMASTTWYQYSGPYRDSAGVLYFPTVVLFRPDGSVADYFIARGTLGTNPGFYNRVKNTTDQYPDTGTPPATSTPGTIGFGQPSLTVSEGVSSVSVTVTRQGGSSGAQTFSYATVAGTAVAGVDYTGAGGALVWGDGDTAPKTVTVGLVNDNQFTLPTARTFSVRLSRLSGTATLGSSLLTVTVNEVTADPASAPPAFVSPTPASGSAVSAVLNGAVNIQTRATGSAPLAYSATGLPAGLSINTGTGLISGTPTVAGNSTVTLNVSNSKGSATTSFTLRVASLAAIASGTYRGSLFDADQQTVRGTLTLSANTAGTITAQTVLDGSTYSFTGKWLAGSTTAELPARSGGGILSVQVDELGILTGTFGDAAVFGRRVNLAGVGEFAGYYTSLLSATAGTPNSDEVNNLPEGTGYVTFTISSLGSVRYSGVLADGTLVSGSSTILTYSGTELADLGYAGVADDQRYATFPIYTPLYLRRGVIAAQVWIDGFETASPNDNRVFLAGSQWVYPGRSATATADGFTATLDDGAFTEIGAAFVKPENLAEAFADTSFQSESGIVPVQGTTGLTIVLPSGNELKATLTASRTTGLFSGRFLYTPDEGSPYTVSFAGALVPALGIGGGYFRTPDNSFPGYRVQRSRPVVIAP